MSELTLAAEKTVQSLMLRGKMLVTAESCTAGLVADALAGIEGASKALWGGFVVYTPDAKVKALGVDRSVLEEFGAVSRETVSAMAIGALERSGADIAVAVTGLAGPCGDGSGTLVGTVWIGLAERTCGSPCLAAVDVSRFSGSRNEIRLAAASAALGKVFNLLWV